MISMCEVNRVPNDKSFPVVKIPVSRILLRFFLALAALSALPHKAEATTRIQRVVSPGGVEAWLVESHSVPMVTMNMSFRGGASQDPVGKPGVANFASWMLNEGAGEMKTQELLSALRKLAVLYSKSATTDDAVITFTSLTKHKDAAFDLLRLMLVSPRFDEDPMARGRKSILADIEASKEDPSWILGRQFRSELFPHHFYGREVQGSVGDLREYHYAGRPRNLPPLRSRTRQRHDFGCGRYR
jgi:zinc protease